MVLSDSDLDKWLEKEHTKIKHSILLKYMDAWIKILGRYNNKICYWDCFAGRGELVDANHNPSKVGSPRLILDLAKKYSRPGRKILTIFLENNKDNFNHLKILLERDYGEAQLSKLGSAEYYTWEKNNISIYAKLGDFDSETKILLASIGPEETIVPSFFFIDPFGFGGYPFDINKKILSFKKTEIFVTFMVRDMIRFMDVDQHKRALNGLFGPGKWREYVKTCDNKVCALRDLFIQRLQKNANAKYFIAYPISMDEQRKILFYLIHITNNFKGLKVMKDIMFNESKSATEMGYRGPDNNQLSVGDFAGNDSQIKRELLRILEEGISDLEAICEKMYMETKFVWAQFLPILKKMQSEGTVEVNREPAITKTRRPVTAWNCDKYKIIVKLKTHAS